MKTVADVMRHVNNFFETGYRGTTYTISGGALEPNDVLCPGMWIYISGSLFYDGVWRLGEGMVLEDAPDASPTDTFYGRIWFLAPPADFLALCDEIGEFRKKNAVSPFQSESFEDVYSYTRAQGKNGGSVSWEGAFADRLRPYRRMFTEVG